MNKSSLRNLLGTAGIIVCNLVVLLTQQSKFESSTNDMGSFIAIIAVSTILSGMIGGILAPYTYKKVVLYVEGILVGIILIGGLILYIIGEGIGDSGNILAELTIIIILFMLVILIIISVIVSSICLFIGAFFGSKIGKIFTQNYTLESEISESFSDTPFPSQM
jgi:hypothetical protein